MSEQKQSVGSREREREGKKKFRERERERNQLETFGVREEGNKKISEGG